MSKFNRPGAYTAHSPVTTTEPTTTYEGGTAWLRDEKSELVMLAVTNMVGEDTFYESASNRDDRYAALVRKVAVADPHWLIKFVTWLRNDANMRSASLVAAAEGVKARLEAQSGLPNPTFGVNRKLVAAPLVRPDEPGEFLAYWTSRFGRKLPQPVKRGVADAVRRLYTERSLLKYDTASHGWRFGDVIDMVHPAPADDRRVWQGDLFKHALDRRHGHDEELPLSLHMIRNNQILRADTGENIANWLDPEILQRSGMTWEDVLSARGGTADKAELWKALIPSMGYMALLRNLRNFDEAGVSDAVAAGVCERLADPSEVARSRQFPFRFLSAYRAAPSLRWGHALEKALYHACGNVPVFKGRTLVLVDTSGSMGRNVSAKSAVRHVDVGALFGVALAVRGADVDLVGFADGSFHHPLVKGAAVLRQTEAFMMRLGEVGHGTQTVTALRANYNKHDRVVIVSDMQAFAYPGWVGSRVAVSEAVPANVPMFGINTTGYAQTSIDTSKPNRYEIGGFSDKLFTMVDLLARGRDAAWPWEA